MIQRTISQRNAKFFEEEADIEILKVAEEKVKYLRKTNKK